jgi:hypothetical protein
MLYTLGWNFKVDSTAPGRLVSFGSNGSNGSTFAGRLVTVSLVLVARQAWLQYAASSFLMM